ncbi:lipopolysaccharide assembly protein LapB [Thiohalospira sp.]|uniref:lipopolysaccharide assembly protein LapB n=1 Tax=Thiohalospira sp. TaxID=3080549 RepID=UPI0039818994
MDLPLAVLFLLLPLAALSGWFIGRRGGGAEREDCPPGVNPEYLRGLSYLLEDRTDKAIDLFTRMLEVDSETVELHLALGSLFRRRGEVDRAIRIHQNLIARPTLTRPQREQALYELGLDHMRAGLFDRAEELFGELVERGDWSLAALRQLRAIYEQEKEWDNAIRAARKLMNAGESDLGPVVAQYHCELAELDRAAGRGREAERHLRQALGFDRHCVRASLIETDMALAAEAWRSAIKAGRRVADQDPDFLAEALPRLRRAYEAMGRPLEILHWLRELDEGQGQSTPLLAMVDLMERQQGPDQAALFLRNRLTERPSLRGLERYVALTRQRAEPGEQRDLEPVHTILERMVADQPLYQCTHCGFRGRVLHWQCPSCKHWTTVKPGAEAAA